MWDWIAKLGELRAGGKPFAVVTAIRCDGSTPCTAGAKMLVTAGAEAEFFGTIGGGHLEQLALADARGAIAAGGARTFRYPLGAKAGQCCGGVVELLVEVVGGGPELWIFGAGHVAQALARTLEGTPFAVHAIDEREDWLDRMPSHVRRHARTWDEALGDLRFDESRTFVAIMTHRHDVDQEIVAAVVARPARYLGLIGSETKWRRFRERLEARCVKAEALARVKCPIGLDVGGKSPQEVAVSIAAELLKVHHGR